MARSPHILIGGAGGSSVNGPRVPFRAKFDALPIEVCQDRVAITDN